MTYETKNRSSIAESYAIPLAIYCAAQWQARQTALDTPCRRCCRWQKQEIMRSNVMESGVRHQRTRPSGAEQYRIPVKFTARYREPGQWIDRVVFNQTDQAARADYPPHLAQKPDPLRWRHMMEHADRYRKIEGCTAVGKGLAQVGFVLDLGPLLGSARPLM